MANELHLSYLSGYTTYAILRNGAGEVYSSDASDFETWDDANIGYYAISLTDKSGGLYNGTMPVVAAGTYFIQLFLQSGASPAITDSLIDTYPMEWDGTGEISLDDLGGPTWGAGVNTVTLTIRTTGGSTISGVTVWVYTSNDATQSIVTPRTTGGSGTVQFSLDDGTFYAFCYKEGYTFIASGTTNRVTVSGTTAATLDLGTAVSTGTASYYTQSFLTRALADAREFLDEPGINAKYLDARMIRRIEDAYNLVIGDIHRVSVTPVVARYTVTYVDGTEVYRLPPVIHSVIAIYSTGSSGYRLFYDSNSPYNPVGRGVWLEGKALHVQSSWLGDGATIVVEYIPNCPRLMNGTFTVAAAGTIVTLGDAYQGTKDTRPNAYAGCIFRVLADSDSSYNYMQERTITAHDPTANTVTLDAALDPNNYSSTGTSYFEIVPPIPLLMDQLVPMYCALQVSAVEGNVQRAGGLRRMYEDAIRNAQLTEFYSNLQNNALANPDDYQNYRRRPRYRV